jgi:2-polyprenyl-3-methyl-5-hydroxy-6-metoxy-1,4-benzoquinol methylase/glycosyltransferase involved in cell wall biosynthesis
LEEATMTEAVDGTRPEEQEDLACRQLRRVLSCLPPEVLSYLGEHPAYVLHFGCGSGAGTDLLARRFPRCAAAGLEFSAAAVCRARQRWPAGDFLLAPAGEMTRTFDVVFCTAGLAQDADPLARLRCVLASCRGLCVVVVPDNVYPLPEGQRAQFREESFPEHLATFRATLNRVLEADPEQGLERARLVVYASAASRRTHGRSQVAAAELDKWDDFYAGLGEAHETESLRAFHAEFTTAVEGLLGPAGSVLEAGCGAGFQSLALARLGKYAVALMDISGRALDRAAELFAREGLTAQMLPGDVFAPGQPRFDLVFNAGVLEHYTLAQQADFLRGMASRSRRWVLVLVPNRLCYWYWVWRVRGAACADWPFGKESPLADLSAAFAAAGLSFVGQAFLGAAWTEDLLGHVRGLDEALRRDLLAVHRSPLLDRSHQCYLLAALGTVGPAPAQPPAGWSAPGMREDYRLAEVVASLADSLALRLRAETQLRDLQARLDEQRQRHQALLDEHERTRDALAEATRRYRDLLGGPDACRTYRLAQKLAWARLALAPLGSWREHTARTLFHGARRAVRAVTSCLKRSALPQLAEVRRRCRDGRRPFVFLPSIPWTATLFQRPQHLARELARLGHVVLYDCTGTTEDLAGLREIEANLFLYKGERRHLRNLPGPVLWAFSYNFDQKDSFPSGTACVYDWIDDLAVFPYDPRFLRRNHERGLREATLVASVARRLHQQALAVRPDALYLPNATEHERFAAPDVPPPDDPEVARFRLKRRPLAGYYGALASWFDYALLEETARRRPDWDFLLIGPDYDGSLPGRELLRLPNVAWLGPRPYPTLPGYLRLFDVALIPFVLNDITLATSPLKLYEYFSAGKPVLTTAMPECAAHPEVRIVRDAAELSRSLDAALADAADATFRRRLQALGEVNSWAARARTVLERLAAPAQRRAA